MVNPMELKKGTILISRDEQTISVKQNDAGGWVADDTERSVAIYMAYLQDASVKEKLKINDYWINEYKKLYEARKDIAEIYKDVDFKIYKMINKYYAEEI